MGQKVMLEATQSVVDGNTVVHAAGEQWESLDKVPEGVPVRPVLVDVPDDPRPAAAPPPVPADAPAKSPGKGK
jgi:hypothetical protein